MFQFVVVYVYFHAIRLFVVVEKRVRIWFIASLPIGVWLALCCYFIFTHGVYSRFNKVLSIIVFLYPVPIVFVVNRVINFVS
jgi:hypothetical protein